jgi:hypothetical protein
MTAVSTDPRAATLTAQQEPPAQKSIRKVAGRNWDHVFFPAMSIVIALVVFIGFARTYFLAGLFHAKPLPAPIVHIHGAVFTGWIALLVVQTSLVGTGHTRIHRRLGLIGLALAPLIVILGALVADEMLNRFAATPAVDSKTIFAVALSEILGFAVPVFFAFRFHRKPAFHKRLVLIGTIAITTAGFGRWPVHFLLHKPLPAMLAMFSLLGLVAAYDLLTIRKIHRATVLAAAWVVCVELTATVLGQTAAWHSLAARFIHPM